MSAKRPRGAETKAAWRARNPGLTQQYNETWRQRNMERALVIHRMTERIRHAIRSGKLIRPTKCEGCGRTDRPIEAAHHDYSKPLDVRWLCRPCHRLWDSEHPKTLGELPPPAHNYPSTRRHRAAQGRDEWAIGSKGSWRL